MQNLTEKELRDLAWAAAEMRAEQKARAIFIPKNKPVFRNVWWLAAAFAVLFVGMCGVCGSLLYQPARESAQDTAQQIQLALETKKSAQMIRHLEIALVQVKRVKENPQAHPVEVASALRRVEKEMRAVEVLTQTAGPEALSLEATLIAQEIEHELEEIGIAMPDLTPDVSQAVKTTKRVVAAAARAKQQPPTVLNRPTATRTATRKATVTWTSEPTNLPSTAPSFTMTPVATTAATATETLQSTPTPTSGTSPEEPTSQSVSTNTPLPFPTLQIPAPSLTPSTTPLPTATEKPTQAPTDTATATNEPTLTPTPTNTPTHGQARQHLL
jgi:hypothetical protein